MKKLISLVVVCLMVLGVFSACSNAPANNAESSAPAAASESVAPAASESSEPTDAVEPSAAN